MSRLSVFCAVLSLVAFAFADDQHQHALTEEEVGSVHFLTSCAPAVEKDFNRAVALLHSFQYEQTRAAFEAIAQKDPSCAMAQWGVAMSYYHGLWDNSDVASGRAAWKKADQAASTNPKTSAREKGYIDAIGEIYREDDRDMAAR